MIETRPCVCKCPGLNMPRKQTQKMSINTLTKVEHDNCKLSAHSRSDTVVYFMKLSSLTPQDKIRLAAELDCGYEDFDMLLVSIDLPRILHGAKRSENKWHKVKPYSTSYDAIIPLIQKQAGLTDKNMPAWIDDRLPVGIYIWNATPSQLLDALLVATRKATI